MRDPFFSYTPHPNHQQKPSDSVFKIYPESDRFFYHLPSFTLINATTIPSHWHWVALLKGTCNFAPLLRTLHWVPVWFRGKGKASKVFYKTIPFWPPPPAPTLLSAPTGRTLLLFLENVSHASSSELCHCSPLCLKCSSSRIHNHLSSLCSPVNLRPFTNLFKIAKNSPTCPSSISYLLPHQPFFKPLTTFKHIIYLFIISPSPPWGAGSYELST